MSHGDSTTLNFFSQSKEITFADTYHNTNLPLASKSQRCIRNAHCLVGTDTRPFLLKCGNVQFPPKKNYCQRSGTASYFCFLCLPASPTCQESFWFSGAPCLSKHLPHQFGRAALGKAPQLILQEALAHGPWPACRLGQHLLEKPNSCLLWPCAETVCFLIQVHPHVQSSRVPRLREQLVTWYVWLP